MLTPEENEMLTRVGPGTPCGDMLRYYWWPIGFTEEITTLGIPRPVRLLGEDLILFRDGQGRPGIIGLRCSHRQTSLEYGRVEAEGLRCPYHGWMFDINGRCVDQPAEPEGSTFKDHIRHPAYLAQDLGGFIFAYLGPQPAPLLPRYDLLVREDGERTVHASVDHCNWLQRAENPVDQGHLAILHASGYPQFAFTRPEIEWERTWYGIRAITRFPTIPEAKISIYVFPAHNRFTSARVYGQPGHSLHFRVPLDDYETATFGLRYVADPEEKRTGLKTKGMEPSEPYVYTPVDNGTWRVKEEDRMVAELQGRITNRSLEHLGHSDRGVILMREMVKESIEAVRQGRDPVGVIRDVEDNECIEFEARMYELAALS
jgi:5,5'-dehydrodivanillate O-demethylase